MVKFILVFLLVMSILYIIKNGFEIIKTFLQMKEYKQEWYKMLLLFCAISYFITFLSVGI